MIYIDVGNSEGFQKKKEKKWNFPLGWWSVRPDFPLKKRDHFMTHLFFSIFGWGDPSQPGSEGRVKP